MLLHLDSEYACTLTLGRQPKCNAKEAISSLNFLCFHLNTFSHSMHYPTANSFHCVCSFFLFTLFNTENLSKLQEGICIASPSMQGWMSWEGEVCFTCSLRTFNTESHREPKKNPYKGIITRPEQSPEGVVGSAWVPRSWFQGYPGLWTYKHLLHRSLGNLARTKNN